MDEESLDLTGVAGRIRPVPWNCSGVGGAEYHEDVTAEPHASYTDIHLQV